MRAYRRHILAKGRALLHFRPLLAEYREAKRDILEGRPGTPCDDKCRLCRTVGA